MVCFVCNKPRHISTQCPQLGGTGPAKPVERRMLARRLFNLSKIDTAVDSKVIKGTFLIQDILMHVLIDSGATHSFISYATINFVRLNTKGLNEPISVQSPMGIMSIIHQVMPKCQIMIGRNSIQNRFESIGNSGLRCDFGYGFHVPISGLIGL